IKYGPYLMAAEGRRYEVGNRLAGSFTEGWLSDLNSSIVKGEGGLVLKTADFDVPLRKYGEITNDFYTVYFERIDAFSEDDLKPNLAMRAEISSSLGYPFYPDNTQIERTFYDMHVSGIAKYLFAIVDGQTGDDSRGKYGSDKTMNRAFLLYAPSLNFPAGQHWIEFDFGEEQSISSLKIAFAYGEGLATRYPTNFVVQYYSDGQWVNVSNQVNPVFGSGFNNVTFDTVNTSRMRISMKNSFSVSVLEVKI
ncbi:MAG: discoidin domain-containing protein, partial [Christensenellales bacterium]